MFAHQIIQELTLNKFKYNKEMQEQINRCLPILKRSVKFQIESLSDIYNIFNFKEGDSGQAEIFGDKKYLKFPYKEMYIEIHACPKDFPIRGILSQEINKDEFEFFFFFKWGVPLNHWDILGIVTRHKLTERKITKYITDKINDEDFLIKDALQNLTILDFFIKLINCKNIESVDHRPSERLNKANRRRGKQELFTYKSLQIKLPGIRREKNESLPTGEHNRIHFIRGHFKEYTEDHPLFGKVTGLWWWQPHVRGQNKEGIIFKDYKVEIKNQEETK
jgi:hypothetical protein